MGAGSGGIIAVVVTNVVVVAAEMELEIAVVVVVIVCFGCSLSKANRCCEPANRPTKT